MKYSSLYLFVLLALLSCKKVTSDLEGSNQPTPIYMISALVDEQPIDFIVNDSSIFMDYGTENLNGVTTYYTEFENRESNQVFKFSLTAPEAKYRSLSNYTTNNQSVDFLIHQANCYNLVYSHPPQSPPILMISPNQTHWIPNAAITLNEYGIYKIPLRFKALSSKTFYQTIEHGFESKYSADFLLENTENDIMFSSIEKGNTHSWFLDGAAIGTGSNGTVLVNTGIHNITHIIHDQLGNVFEKTQVFYSHLSQLRWLLKVEKCHPILNNNNFEKAIISFEEDGILYSSEYAEENEDQKIEISDIDYFLEKDNNGKISFKFTANFSGTLISADLSKKKKLTRASATCKYVIK